MARVVVIGGSGHIGTYLIPLLVGQGYDVVNVSRGQARSYQPDPAWAQVEQVMIDRIALERSGRFGQHIADLQPDVVVDLISFDLPGTQALVEALRGRVSHFLHCGTIWVYGRNAVTPAEESDPLNPEGEYGTQKAAIETWLLREARLSGFPATVFRPGHIVGPGWAPINPQGHVNPEVFSQIARGETLVLPNFGLETVHHVHAADVAQVVSLAMLNRAASMGEAFNAVSSQALNLRGYAEAMYRWFGVEPRLAFLPFDEWKDSQTADDADKTFEHIIRSPCHSIEKARVRLGYVPRYSSLAAVQESVRALIDAGKVEPPAAWRSSNQ